jgi:creatinine amidohydrolase
MSKDQVHLPRWADLRWPQLAALDPERSVAVLPVGATEQHGPHLPLGVDSVIAEAVLDAAAPHLQGVSTVLQLPTLPIGLSPEHAAYPGTLSLSAATAQALWCEVGASVARAGLRKLVILNGHGGHVGLMDIVGRELRLRHQMLVWGVSWYQLPWLEPDGHDLEGDLSASERRFGVHAGQVETSVMLALAPHTVDRAALADFSSTSAQRAQQYPILGNGRSAKLAWQMQDLNPAGAAGNAAAADPDWGRRVIQAAGRALAQLLREVLQVPLATAAPGPHAAP